LRRAATSDSFPPQQSYPDSSEEKMFAAIGNLMGRKPATTAAPAVPAPYHPAPAGNARPTAATSRRREDPRDVYARVFRFKPAGGEMPTSVEIIGSFTRWQTVTLTHDKLQNMWTATITGIPGKKTHHYMLLVNGVPVHDPACDGLAEPMGFDEEQYALQTAKGPRVLMMFAQTK
jgi:hypothetical protein